MIARVKVRFPVSIDYQLSEEAALAQAFLDYGAMTELTASQTESGWHIEGTAHTEAAINLE